MKLKNIGDAINIFEEFQEGKRTIEELTSAYEKLGKVGKKAFHNYTNTTPKSFSEMVGADTNGANTAAADANATANENLAASEQAVASGANASASALANDTAAKQANAAASREAAAANETYQASQRSVARTNAATSASSAQNVANNTLSQNQNTHMLAQSVPQSDPNNFLQNNRLGKTIDNVSSAALGASALKRLGKSVDDVDDKTRKASQSANSLRKAIADGSDAAKTGSSTFDDFASTADKVVTNADLLDDMIEDVSKSNTKTAAKNTSSLTSALIGLSTVIKSIPVGAIALFGASIAGAFALRNYQQNMFSNAVESASESASAYQNTADELSNVNDQLSTQKQRIKEIRQLQKSGKATFEDNVELEQLQASNEELKRKQILTESYQKEQAKTAASDAYKALNAPLTQSLTKKNNPSVIVSGAGAYVDHGQYTSVLNATRTDMQTLRDLQDQRDQLYQDLDKTKGLNLPWNTTKTRKDIEDIESQISDYNSTIADNIAAIQDQANTLSAIDPKYITAEQKASLREANDILAEYTYGQEQSYAKSSALMNGLFNQVTGSDTGIKDFILDEIIDSGKSATDVIKSLGIELSDLGDISPTHFNQYFNQLAKNADRASKSINYIDGSMEGVTASLETANDGATLDTFSEALTNAESLYKKGLVGTDDFRTVAKLINSGNDGSNRREAYTKNFETNLKKLKEYISVDEETGDVKKSGISKFVNDLAESAKSQGKGFKNTAQAAKALGIPTEVFEMLVGKASEFGMYNYGGYSFKKMDKSAQSLSDAKSQLEEMKALRDSMDSGEDRQALSDKIKAYSKEIKAGNKDLTKFDTNLSDKMQKDLDLVNKKQAFKDANQFASDSGEATDEANALASGRDYLDTLKERLGLNKKNAKMSDKLAQADQKVADAEKSLKNADTTEEKANARKSLLKSIEDELSLLEDLQKQQDKEDKQSDKKNKKNKNKNKNSDDSESGGKSKRSSKKNKNSVDNSVNREGIVDNPVSIKSVEDGAAAISTLKEKLATLDDSTQSYEVRVQANADIDNLTQELANLDPEIKASLGIDPNWTAEEIEAYFNGNEIGIPGSLEVNPQSIDSTEEQLQANPLALKTEINSDGVDWDGEEYLGNASIEDLSFLVEADADDAVQTVQDVKNSLEDIPTEKDTELSADGNMGDMALEVISSLTGIPTEVLTMLSASGNASSVVAAVLAQILGIPATKMTQILASGNAGQIAAAAFTALGLIPSSKNVNITASGNAEANAQNAESAVQDVSTSHNTVLSASGNAISQARAAAAAIYAIPRSRSSVITVTRHNITINETRSKSVNGTAHYFGTAHSFGTAFADGSITKRNFLNKSNSIGSRISRDINKQFGISDQDNKRKNSGTAKASGDWSVKKDQTSLINEVGRNYFATLYGNM